MSITPTKRQQSRHLPAFILLALADCPAHGGALMSGLNARFPALKADTAAVYRALQQLEKNGELVSRWDTSGKGPAIRIYSVSVDGLAALEAWKQDIDARIALLHDFQNAYAALKPEGN